jgi:hypothetical protein
MKNFGAFILFSVISLTTAWAQTPLSNSDCDVTLTIQADNGTNGVAVTYNPSNQLYYTVFAGNAEYPLETHDVNGNSIATQAMGFDVRGLWYNPATKQLEGITYNNEGSYVVTLDDRGMIAGTKMVDFSYGMESQTVATYAGKKKGLMFIEDKTVYFFKPGKLSAKKVELKTYMNYLNTNGPIWTGVKNYEIGLFDPETAMIRLFSASSGKETGAVALNVAECNELDDMPYSFRVSYCNDRVFLFDTYSRTWTGYKLF